MFRQFWTRSLAAAVISVVSALTLSGAASAHHGWSWTTGENIELTGVIRAVALGYPHGKVMLEVDGTWWTLEVGQPWRNERAGLKDGDLAEGVKITVSGEPAKDKENKLLKVERLWIQGKQYELYPERS